MEIKVVKKILDVNDTFAAENRKWFEANHVFVLNMMSSPGSGKTSILEKSLSRLGSEVRCGVIVGDICTTNDADRLVSIDTPVVQINTDEFGGDCHLSAHVIRKAAEQFDLDKMDLLIVENIGNLVCPAEFDIGEDARAVVLSVTEGEDKPLKYPLMFRVCDVALLNKIDLLPYLIYDRQLVADNIRQIHSDMPVFEVSAQTGDGLAEWILWLQSKVYGKKGCHRNSPSKR